jgi:drug/metabolite transporter (DMT)-like permease
MLKSLSSLQLAILYMVFASFLFALTMAFAKLLSVSMGAVEVTFWRNAIGLIVVGITLFHTPINNIGGKPYTLLFRGVIGTIALLTFFYTIGETTLSNAIVYAKTEPIFTAILAFFLLKEKLKFTSYVAIFIGFFGVVILSGMEWNLLHAMGILTGFLSALAYISVRNLSPYYDERTIVLSFMICGTVIPLILMISGHFFVFETLEPFFTPFVVPSLIDSVWIILMGIAAAFGQIYMTRAYFYAKAGIVSAVSYSVVLFATIFGIFLGDTLPTFSVLFGGAMIVLSGILLSRNKG